MFAPRFFTLLPAFQPHQQKYTHGWYNTDNNIFYHDKELRKSGVANMLYLTAACSTVACMKASVR